LEDVVEKRVEAVKEKERWKLELNVNKEKRVEEKKTKLAAKEG